MIVRGGEQTSKEMSADFAKFLTHKVILVDQLWERSCILPSCQKASSEKHM